MVALGVEGVSGVGVLAMPVTAVYLVENMLVVAGGAALAIGSVKTLAQDEYRLLQVKEEARQEANTETGNWNKGSFDSSEESLKRHFKKHGEEVGAKTLEEYLRKAEEFAKTAKKGSTKSKVYGEVEGVIRYKKNGKYIDLAPDGSIISFGKQ